MIVSDDAANQHHSRVQVVSLTGSVSRLFPSKAYARRSGEQRMAMADQRTTLSTGRPGQRSRLLWASDQAGVE